MSAWGSQMLTREQDDEDDVGDEHGDESLVRREDLLRRLGNVWNEEVEVADLIVLGKVLHHHARLLGRSAEHLVERDQQRASAEGAGDSRRRG